MFTFHRVTVFGESAGGASATYLMMSPLSKGKKEKKREKKKRNKNQRGKYFSSHRRLNTIFVFYFF